ncbi:hypothetical protein [Amycolatopsis sp. NPDC051102]|uniref:hypothetical protein n=1 Tax=Amycolatopsis sp. NPDC051102 TaxID=3155163 RepID=UPI003442FD32
MAYRKNYTAEDRAAFAEADAALADAAHRVLADPAELERLVTQMLTIRSPRILRYSLRNQAMLINQARERGTTLTDLDTARGWSQRGRSVLEDERERPYRLTIPKGTETVDGDAADHDGQDHDDTDGGEGKETRSRFRTRTYYDYAQTEGLDDTMPGFRPSAVDEPEAVLRDSLADQLARFGYTVVFDDVDTVEVNDDAEPPVIAVPAADAVVGMARALGSILSRPPKERPRQRPAERASADDAAWITDKPVGTRRVRLDLRDYGTAIAWAIPRPDSGTVVYKVTGRRLFGTWTVHSEDAANHDTITSATVRYGDYSGADFYNYGQAPSLPTVNGIELLGSCGAITPDRVAQLDRYRVRPRRSDDGGRSSYEVPEKTADRTAAVVRALLADFYARDDLDQLHQARARHEAPRHRATAARTADHLKRRISELTEELGSAVDQAARYGAIADTPDQD